MRIKQLLYTAFAACIFISCQKEPDFTEPDATPPASSNSCKPLKAYLHDDFSGTIIEDSAQYEYSGNKLTKIVLNDDAYFEYQYNGDKVTKRIYSGIGAPDPYNYRTFTYNADGTLARMEEITDNFMAMSIKYDSVVFSYSGSKLTGIREYLPDMNGQMELRVKIDYAYTGNNISKQYQETYDQGILTWRDSTIFTYDNKPNYFRKQAGQFFLTDPFFLEFDSHYYAFAFSENNIIREEEPGQSFDADWSYITDTKGNLVEVKLEGHTYQRYFYQCQ